MKTIVTMIGAAALVLAAATVASATVLYQQDFENGGGANAWVGEGATAPGLLVGQDGWFNYSVGAGITIGVGTGPHAGGNLGELDDEQVLPLNGGVAGYASRNISGIGTGVYSLTWDEDNFDGGIGFAIAGGSHNGEPVAIIDNAGGGMMAFDCRTLLGVSYPSGYGMFPVPTGFASPKGGLRSSFAIVMNVPAGTISAYYNYSAEGGGGSGYVLGSQFTGVTPAEFAMIGGITFFCIQTGSNPGAGEDNIQVQTGDVTVPEPSTLALLSCGLVSLGACAWRKRK
jgi:hypothetical protein